MITKINLILKYSLKLIQICVILGIMEHSHAQQIASLYEGYCLRTQLCEGYCLRTGEMRLLAAV